MQPTVDTPQPNQPPSPIVWSVPLAGNATAAEKAAPAAAAAMDAGSSDSYGSPESSSSSMDDEEAERVQQAVEVVAEMQLTAEQLKVRQDNNGWQLSVVLEAAGVMQLPSLYACRQASRGQRHGTVTTAHCRGDASPAQLLMSGAFVFLSSSCLALCAILQTGLRTLPPTLSSLFGPEGSAVEAAVRETAKQCSSDLRQRAAQELPLLPFSR
jgi:hypothetical protein